MPRLVFVVLTLCVFTVSIAQADGLSHLGQPVGNLVTVLYEQEEAQDSFLASEAGPPAPQIVSSHAIRSPFVIPQGQVFVITDVEWYAETTDAVWAQEIGGPSSYAGRSASFLIELSGRKGDSRVFFSKAVPIVPIPGGKIQGAPVSVSGHENLTAGIVVSSDVKIVPDLWGFPTDMLEDSYVVLHGYFMPDPTYVAPPKGAVKGATPQGVKPLK